MATARRQKTKDRCIYKNLDTGKYDIMFNYKVYNPLTGGNDYKQKMVSGFATISEAKKKLADLKSGGVKRESEAITLNGAYELWKQQATSVKNYSPVTLKNTKEYMRMIGQFIDLDTRVMDIDDRVYMKFCSKLKEHGYTNETLRNLNGCLRKLINLCYKKKLIVENPLSFVDNMSVGYKDKDSYRLVDKVEFDRMYRWLEEHQFVRLGYDCYPRYKVCITVLYYTGMRIGECLALTPADIDNGVINVDKSYVSDLQLVKSPKNLKHRKISVPVWVTDLVTEFIEKDNIGTSDRIFDITHGAVDSVLKKVCKELCIKSVSCHCFRHTYISNLLRAGVPIAVCEKMSGDTQQTILARYSNYFDSDVAMVVNALEEL